MLRYPRTSHFVLKGHDGHLNSGNSFGSANLTICRKQKRFVLDALLPLRNLNLNEFRTLEPEHKEQEMSLMGLGWRISAETVLHAVKIIPLRLCVMEIMRELLAVFMSTKDSGNELFYRNQGNAASVGLTGPTQFGLRGGPCRAPFPIRLRVL